MPTPIPRTRRPPACVSTAAALAVAASLGAAGTAAAAMTVGSQLRSRADFSTSCPASGGCTVLGSASVPKAGVVARWRLRAATRGLVRLRVLRPTAGGLIGVASDPLRRLERHHSPGRDVTYAFTSRVPVQRGDLLALDIGRGAAVLHRRRDGASVILFAPAVPTGGAAPAGARIAGAELLMGADVEPDNDGDGFGDETQDNCPSIANDQTSNPCPSTPVAQTPEHTVPRSTGWRRHKHRRHPFRP
jgi:hypothetical protein